MALFAYGWLERRTFTFSSVFELQASSACIRSIWGRACRRPEAATRFSYVFKLCLTSFLDTYLDPGSGDGHAHHVRSVRFAFRLHPSRFYDSSVHRPLNRSCACVPASERPFEFIITFEVIYRVVGHAAQSQCGRSHVPLFLVIHGEGF